MNKTIWLIDIDGTVCEDIPNEESHRFRHAEVLPGALEKVQELYDNGDRITFFTARTHDHAVATEAWLNDNGFPFETVVYNKPRIKEGEVYCWVDNKPVLSKYTPKGLK